MTSPYVIPNDSATGAFVAPGGGTGLDRMGEGIGALLQGIGHFTNPYHDFHEKIREMLASNPEAIGHLADYAQENPTAFGALQKMFPKDVLGAISQIHASPESQTRMRARENAPLLDVPTSELAKMDLTPSQLETIRGAAGSVPGALQQTATVGAQAGGEAAVYSHLTPEEKDAADHYSIAYFKHLKDVADQERLRREFQHASTALSAQEHIDRLHEMTVEIALRKYNVGTVESWTAYYDDPKVQQRAHDLATGKINPVSGQDQQLLQMGMAIDRAPSEMRAREQSGVMRTLNAIRDRIVNGYHVSGEGSGVLHHDTPEDIKSIFLPSLQRQLDILASPQFGGPKLKAEYVPPPARDIAHPLTFFQRGAKLIIRDETGNEVDPTVIATMTARPDAADPQSVAALLADNPAAAEAWNRIVQSGDIRGGLAALHAADLRNGRTLMGGMWKQIMDVLERVTPADANDQP